MGKLLTIVGGCVVVAGGLTYGVYTSHYGCPLAGAGCSAPALVESDCCEHGIQSINTSAGDEGGCPFAAAAKATCPGGTSADGEDCCAAALAGTCPGKAGSDAGLTAVAGAALSAGGK